MKIFTIMVTVYTDFAVSTTSKGETNIIINELTTTDNFVLGFAPDEDAAKKLFRDWWNNQKVDAVAYNDYESLEVCPVAKVTLVEGSMGSAETEEYYYASPDKV